MGTGTTDTLAGTWHYTTYAAGDVSTGHTVHACMPSMVLICKWTESLFERRLASTGGRGQEVSLHHLQP